MRSRIDSEIPRGALEFAAIAAITSGKVIWEM